MNVYKIVPPDNIGIDCLDRELSCNWIGRPFPENEIEFYDNYCLFKPSEIEYKLPVEWFVKCDEHNIWDIFIAKYGESITDKSKHERARMFLFFEDGYNSNK